MPVVERQSPDFGAMLREARERRGLSLRVIADKTRISVRVLDALERNDISRLPGGIFSRAFVRAYAVEVGLDPEQAIAEFIARFPHDSVTQGHPRTLARADAAAGRGGRALTWMLRLALLLLAAGAVLAYFGVIGRLAGR
jgi:cytoskeleton protein RodZ